MSSNDEKRGRGRDVTAAERGAILMAKRTKVLGYRKMKRPLNK